MSVNCKVSIWFVNIEIEKNYRKYQYLCLVSKTDQESGDILAFNALRSTAFLKAFLIGSLPLEKILLRSKAQAPNQFWHF